MFHNIVRWAVLNEQQCENKTPIYMFIHIFVKKPTIRFLIIIKTIIQVITSNTGLQGYLLMQITQTALIILID